MTAATDPTGLVDDLAARADALEQALDSGGAQLDSVNSAHAREVIRKAAERVRLGGEHTVVALAGSTGSGKSSLFNALTNTELAVVGARRPTTSTPTAAVFGPSAAGPLLDWLRVGPRHHLDISEAALDGVVVLDLPDFDSREASHRIEAERVLALADVFVWVTDPQKYADAVLHNEFLAASAEHAAVSLVVLNQVDRLTDAQVQTCLADLRQLLDADGLRGVEVLGASARTGVGLDGLRAAIAKVAEGHVAARRRLTADLRTVAGRLRADVGDAEPDVPAAEFDRLVEALTRTAGMPVVLDAVGRDYRMEAAGRTSWLFTRWVHRLRPDPLKRLRLDPGGPVGEAELATIVRRSSIPPPSPAAKAALTLATDELGDAVAGGLPVSWATAVADAARPPEADLADALDRAVLSTPLRRSGTPWWWSVGNALQWQFGACAVAGLLWLVVLSVLGWLQLPKPDTPTWGPFPVPFVLLVGGVVAGLLVMLLARPLAAAGARRRRAQVQRAVSDAVRQVAQEHLVAPIRTVLARHRTTREALERARG